MSETQKLSASPTNNAVSDTNSSEGVSGDTNVSRNLEINFVTHFLWVLFFF